MGLFDDLKAAISSGDTKQLQSRLEDLTGGFDLDTLKQKFEDAGLGEKVKSWIGTGENEPVSADEVKQAIGEERLQEIAAKSGTDVDTAARQTAETLPQVVDRMTPEGQIPVAR
ncbi:MAG TPA: YidB family protein [Gaiellaceae bacterium]|nr:YidB family protein [Gaiellaceae bacterium]